MPWATVKRSLALCAAAITASAALFSCAEAPQQRPTTVVSRPQLPITADPRLADPAVARAYARRLGMALPTELTQAAFEEYELAPFALPESETLPDTLPAPIPGRLLAKIDPSHVAARFRPSPPQCDLKGLQQLELLPERLPISRVSYAGVTQSGDTGIRIFLEEPMEVERLLAEFAETRAELAADSLPLVRGGAIDHAVVVYDAREIGEGAARPCEPDYYYLAEKSSLRELFAEAGVQTMRRVFRSAEVPERDQRGWFRTRSVEDMMKTVRQNNPVRTGRGDPDAQSPANMANWFVLNIAEDVDLDEALRILKAEGIETLSMDFPVVTATPGDQPYFPDQWGLQNDGCLPSINECMGPTCDACTNQAGFDIKAVDAWSKADLTLPIIVAVIDTGFNENLTELAPRLWTNPGEISGNGADDDCSGFVDDVHGIHAYNPTDVRYTPGCVSDPGGPAMPPGGVPSNTHGTKVAGVIAADASTTDASNLDNGISGAAGLANVQLMNINIGTCDPAATWPTGSAEVAEGLFYAIAKDADVVNMSIHTSGATGLLLEAVEEARFDGMVMVGSAGNDNREFLPGVHSSVVPAGLTGVMAVGGANRLGRRWSSSNHGVGLDLVAPAETVRTLDYDPTDPTQTVADIVFANGTSVAAAHASATAALVLTRYPDMLVSFMRHWLRATADDMFDPNGVNANLIGEDNWTGAGMLNAGAAVEMSGNEDGQIAVEVWLEKQNVLRYRFNGPHHSFYLSVAGDTDIGLRVEPLNPGSLDRWELHVAPGTDLNTTNWTEIPVTGVNNNQPIGVGNPLQTTGVFVDMPSDVQLPTDPLANNALYVVRLTALNRRSPLDGGPRSFTAYDVIRPIRAAIVLPGKGTSIVGRWGWPVIYGTTDIRPDAVYTLALKHAGVATEWSQTVAINDYGTSMLTVPLPILPPAMLDYPFRDSQYYPLLRPDALKATDPAVFPSPPLVSAPEILAEDWYTLELTVDSPPTAQTLGPSTDAVDLFIDNSHFAYKVPPRTMDTGTREWGAVE